MNLRRVFADICRGYSVAQWDDKPVYIKHLTHFDQVDIDEIHDEALATAIKRGIRTEEAQLKWLAGRAMWVLKDEIALKQQRDYVKTLIQTQKKQFASAQIKALQVTIEAEALKLAKMEAHKDDLVSLTAETVADRKVQFTYIATTFYRDDTLKHRLFTDAQMRDMDDDQTAVLLDIYIESISRFSTTNLRTISVANYFVNHFYLCGDDVTPFFGRPICELTSQQANLLSYGVYFKGILTNNQVPDEFRSDPDKLESYVNRSAALQKVLAKTEGAARVGLVMQQEDFKGLGLQDGTAQMQETVAKQYKNGMQAANDMGYRVT
jgi:hypothetical protein